MAIIRTDRFDGTVLLESTITGLRRVCRERDVDWNTTVMEAQERLSQSRMEFTGGQRSVGGVTASGSYTFTFSAASGSWLNSYDWTGSCKASSKPAFYSVDDLNSELEAFDKELTVPNRILAKLLKTDERTPKVALWLIGQMELINSAAPEGTTERSWNGPALLRKAYETFRQHRTMGDPARTESHQNLCDQVLSSLSHLAKMFQKDLEAATTQEVLESDVLALITAGRWTRACGRCQLSTAKLERVDGNGPLWCLECIEGHALRCHACGQPHTKNVQRLALASGKERYYCQEHKRENIAKCPGCDRHYEGEPGNGRNVTWQEIEKELKTRLCKPCATAYLRAGCGHITNRSYNIPEIQNVEDDNRHRDERVGSQKIATYCRTCQEANDYRPQHWPVAKERIKSKKHDEIGSPRQYGVELEICQARKMPKMETSIKNNWTSKRDASLPEFGVEMASTILQGNDGLAVIKQLTDYAMEHKWAVDTRAGFHLHVDLGLQDAAQVDAVAMGSSLPVPSG
jgi:hypothetical protein